MAASAGQLSEPDVCGVCLEPFRDPKFLRCFHTFCAQCIEDVARSSPRSVFQCPTCRKRTSLPAEGVAGLQTNFYIHPQPAQSSVKPQPPQTHVKAPTAPLKRKLCRIHDDKTLEFYCAECDEAICINCKLTKHEGHTTDDLSSAVKQKKEELAADVARIQDAVDKAQKQVHGTKEEQQALLEKKATVEKDIRRRHAVMVAAADMARDAALQSLHSVTADIESDISTSLKPQEDHLKELLRIQQRLQQTVNGGNTEDVIVVAREMKKGHKGEQAGSSLTSQDLNVIGRPVVDFTLTTDDVIQTARGFTGTVSKVQMEKAAPELKVEKRFKCGIEDDIEVFSLCHVDDDPSYVWVSYERRDWKTKCRCMTFNEDGSYPENGAEQGKVSSKRYTEGKTMYAVPPEGGIDTYCKSLTADHYHLTNDCSGKANVNIEKVTSTDPFETEENTEFTINVGAHRAFDVDVTEQHFVVVEEPDDFDLDLDRRRKVKLYHRPGGDPVATYTPPTPRYQPSDVCFYTLRGQHVLLVTDELNDVIHVVRVAGREMTFVRYLAPGCPLVIQPTAITVDVTNRLWLACRGGDILLISAAGRRENRTAYGTVTADDDDDIFTDEASTDSDD